MVIHSVAVKIYYKFYLLTNEITYKLVRARKGARKPEKVSPAKRETAKKPKPRLKGKKRKPEFTAPKKKRVKQESTF